MSIPMAASPPPTNAPPIYDATHSIEPGDTEITPRKTEIGNMGMADFTRGGGVCVDTRSIPLKAAQEKAEIERTEKATGAEDGNSSAANSKIQKETEDKSEEQADAARDGEIEIEKATAAGDGNSSAANPKNQPAETKAGTRKTKNKSENKIAAASALPVNMSWLERFRKLNPDHRVLIIRALVVLTFLLILAFAVPVLLLVRFHEQQMCQVWVMSLTLCSQVFFVLLFIWRDWWFYTDVTRLYFGPLLAFYAATVIGHRTAIFILHLNTVWAAGYLGYTLALHRLREGTERAIHVLPNPSCHIKYNAEEQTYWTFIVTFILLVVWTTFMAMIVYGLNLTEELLIVLILSYTGWISVAPWLLYVNSDLMHGVILKEPMRSATCLIPFAIFSPVIIYLSVILLVLIHWLLLMALVGFLGYNLAVYVCYLRTAEQGGTHADSRYMCSCSSPV